MTLSACVACGRENPADAKFCQECGQKLDAAVALPGQEERKVVTVLFCDLVGFTSRSEGMDVEDVRGTLQPYHQLVRRELEAYGGTVEKFIGDAVMALFGAPVAHEDDPERAVRAALSILDAVVELRDGDERLGLHVRIGVNTGEALVALGASPAAGEGMASGDVVNTAARLQSAAPVDGVLVGEVTYRATSRVIDYQPAEAIEAKGKSEPVSVWRAVGARSRVGTDVRQQATTPLVGRDDELEWMWSAFLRSRRERAAQLVTLVGVPGIGKSRLVWELFQRVDAEPDLTTWRHGRCLPYGDGVAYWALGEIVKAQAGILESDRLESSVGKLEVAVADLIADRRDAEWVTRHLARLVGGGSDEVVGERDRTEVFAAWRRFLEAVAERGPAVLVFEDLHWADDGLLDFIDYLVEWASGVALLIVCTTRPELLERRGGWGGGKQNAITVALSPLSEQDTARVVAALLEQSALPAEAQTALLARAEGNPLYAEEYVRMLVDRGLLVRDSGVWRLRGGESLPLPESLQGLVSARLDALGGQEKSLLQDAAVLGKVFWLGGVEAISGLSRWQAEEILHRLERRELVRRERQSSVASETEYAFHHALTRDVAYDQIPRRERARRHQRAAEWTETLADERDDQLDVLAHHYLCAVENAQASGAPDAQLAARARQLLRRAGERAYRLDAAQQAERLLRAAQGLTPDDDPQRAYISLMLGRALSNRRAGGESELREARRLLLKQGDVEAAALAESQLGTVLRDRGGSEEGRRLLEQAWSRVADRPATEATARVLGNLAGSLMMASRLDEAQQLAEKLLPLATEAGFEWERERALILRGICRTSRGDAAGLGDLEQAVASARERRASTSSHLINLANVLVMLGDVRAAKPALKDALIDANRFGAGYDIDFITVDLAYVAYWVGDWDAAIDAIEPLARREPGAWYLGPSVRTLVARIASARGNTEAGHQASEDAITAARRIQDPQVLCEALTLGAWLAAQRQDPAARPLLTEVIALLTREAAASSLVHLIAGDLGRLGSYLGDSRTSLIKLLKPIAKNPWVKAALAYLDQHYCEAAGIFETIGALPDAADARHRAGEHLIHQGRHQEGAAELTRALAFWRSVGATAYVQNAEALIQRQASA